MRDSGSGRTLAANSQTRSLGTSDVRIGFNASFERLLEAQDIVFQRW